MAMTQEESFDLQDQMESWDQGALLIRAKQMTGAWPAFERVLDLAMTLTRGEQMPTDALLDALGWK